MRILDVLMAVLFASAVICYFSGDLPALTFIGILVPVFYIAIRYCAQINEETLDIMFSPSADDLIRKHKMSPEQKNNMRKCLRAYYGNQARSSKSTKHRPF